MGCTASKAQTYESPTRRVSGKRLSVHIGGDVAVESMLPTLLADQGSDDNKRAGSIMCGEDTIEILNKIAPRRNKRASCVIGTTTDLNTADSFKDKTTDLAGDVSDLNPGIIAYTCRKGLKPTAPNQDSYCILRTPDFSIFGVFDGHGEDGHLVSNFVKDALPKFVLQDPSFSVPEERKELLKRAFLTTQQAVMQAAQRGAFNADLAGTTATLALYDNVAATLLVGQVGDSSGCLCRFASSGGVPEPDSIMVEKLIEDHKPNDPAETKRIVAAGGEVKHDGCVTYRVYAKGKGYPGMAMSRAIGDLKGHKDAGIIAEPTIRELKLTEEDQILLLCSDGVWEFIQPREAAEIVTRKTELQSGIDALASEAWERWMKEEEGACVDDITAIGFVLKK